MKRIFMFFFVAISMVLSLQSSDVQGEQDLGPITHSNGKIFIVDPVGHYVMIQKEDGKKVSLELTSETEVTLDGKALSLDELDALEKGFIASADHFTNDAGMQRTISLKVQKQSN